MPNFRNICEINKTATNHFKAFEYGTPAQFCVVVEKNTSSHLFFNYRTFS